MFSHPIHHKKWPAAAMLVAVLSGCGGSDGGDTGTRTQVTAVKVFGDSLADSGTFGIKFTVQGNLIYPERVAQSFGLSTGCNFYAFNGTTFLANTAVGCNNFAIGGGVINGTASGYTAADPRGIGVQMATASTAGVRGNYLPTDLVLVDGGGNDAATLVGAYLRAPTDGGAAYLAVLGTLLSTAQMTPIATACAAPASAACSAALAGGGNTYMSALADSFYNIIKAQALDKGAQKVAVLNMPGITNTPRFQFVLAGIQAQAGATARTQSEALFKSWVVSFNTQLATRFAGLSTVAVVDFYTAFNDQISSPAQFGLTNVTTPACPVVGTGSDGLPAYNFPACTSAALSALTPPSGATGGANWWKTYAFSDSFHPTPYGHQLLAQLISRTLAQVGWL
jgi:phospholipase/lecithinase/hemolysin